VVGYNEIGEFVSGILGKMGHNPLILEHDQGRCQVAKSVGLDTICAEETSLEVLEKVNASKAALVLLTTMDKIAIQKWVKFLTAASDSVPMVVLATSHEQAIALSEKGIKQSILAPFEVGLEFLHQALLELKYEGVEAHAILDEVRQNYYTWDNEGTKSDLAGLRMEWFTNEAHHEGTLADFSVRKKTGASVVAVMRGEELLTDTGADFRLLPEDKVAVVGSRLQRAAFSDWARGSGETPKTLEKV